MRAYTSKEELKDEIKKTYTKFIAEFDNIPEEMKDLRAEDVDRTPAENLAYNSECSFHQSGSRRHQQDKILKSALQW